MTALGIDIGGSSVKVGLVDRNGNIIARHSGATPDSLPAFKAVLGSLLAKFDGELTGLDGIGFGCRGIIHHESTLVERLPGAAHFLEGSRLSDLVSDVISEHVLVRADNDARAALAGELAFGAARNTSNALMLTLGTGVGGAVLAEGRILRGARGVAGHLGHLTMEPDGPLCVCGNRGCLETYFSARAMEAEVGAGLHRGVATSLDEIQRQASSLCCEDIFNAAAQGDTLAVVVRDRAVHYLGAALAGLVHAFDPERVILGGQIARAGATIIEPLRKELRWRTMCLLGEEVPIVLAGVADQSGIVGAAALVFRP